MLLRYSQRHPKSDPSLPHVRSWLLSRTYSQHVCDWFTLFQFWFFDSIDRLPYLADRPGGLLWCETSTTSTGYTNHHRVWHDKHHHYTSPFWVYIHRLYGDIYRHRSGIKLFPGPMKHWCIYSRSLSSASLSIWLSLERTTPRWNTLCLTPVMVSPSSLVCYLQQSFQRVFRTQKKYEVDTLGQEIFTTRDLYSY